MFGEQRGIWGWEHGTDTEIGTEGIGTKAAEGTAEVYEIGTSEGEAGRNDKCWKEESWNQQEVWCG